MWKWLIHWLERIIMARHTVPSAGTNRKGYYIIPLGSMLKCIDCKIIHVLECVDGWYTCCNALFMQIKLQQPLANRIHVFWNNVEIIIIRQVHVKYWQTIVNDFQSDTRGPFY